MHMNFLQSIKTQLSRSNNKFISKSLHLIRDSFIYDLYYFFKCKPWMPDDVYIKRLYYKRFGKYPNLANPQTFNEKNNWRKLNDRKDIYTSMVDKYKIKDIVKERCGEEYAFPLLGVWDNPKDINFDNLPEKFVLKNNHAGGVIVCRDKSSFDKKNAIKELKKIQRKNYYLASREWPYKNVERKIIAEKYMGENLTDYKNYCFNGKLTYTFVWENCSRQDGRKPQAHFCGAYNRNWEKEGIEIDYPSLNKNIEKPVCYEKMVEIAEKMSKDIPFVRVDCYCINNNVYVGELTFFPWGAFEKFKDDKWDSFLGSLECLPIEK